MINLEKIKELQNSERIFIPAYFENIDTYIHVIREYLLNKYWNEDNKYFLIWDYIKEYKTIVSNMNFQFILLNWDIVWINDLLTINTRFWNKYNVKLLEIFWYSDWKYRLNVLIPEELKKEFGLNLDILDIWSWYSPEKYNSEISFNEYLDEIVLYSDPFPAIKLLQYDKIETFNNIVDENIMNNLKNLINKLRNLIID